MIIAILAVLGLCLGSFVNALVWRVHEQAEQAETGPRWSRRLGQLGRNGRQHVDNSTKTAKAKTRAAAAKVDAQSLKASVKPDKKADNKYLARLSVINGRSMCPKCKHELAGRDLVPVLSWLSLGGRCRYCHKPISWQYPLVEVLVAGLFIFSYIYWPQVLANEVGASGLLTAARLEFGLWLLLLVGFMALIIYDLRWLLLPNRIVYPLGVVAGLSALTEVLAADRSLHSLLELAGAVAVGGGLFYILYQVSGGKWIGGGDVKLGWLLGLVAATPARACLLIFIASLTGSLVSLPLLATARLKRSSTIPFGPFLIVAAIVVMLFGTSILNWYHRLILG